MRTDDLLNSSSDTSFDAPQRGINKDKMADDCNPVGDPVDRRILYELTDLKVDQDDYKDDSSINENELEYEEDDAFAEQRRSMKSGRSRKSVNSSYRSVSRVSNGEFHSDGNDRSHSYDAARRKGNSMTIN